MVTLESGTNTQLIVDDLSTVTDESQNDTYELRLTKQPTADVDVAILTDGLADVVSIDGAPVTLDKIGGYVAAQMFGGTIAINGAVITRGAGDELGSFFDEGFAVGQLVRLALTADGGTTYVAYDTQVDGVTPLKIVALTDKTMTLSDPLTGVADGSYGLSQISKLSSQGVFTGQVVFTVGTDPDTGDAVYRMTRVYAGDNWLQPGWLADGFLEGQRIRIEGGANAGDYKIAIIRGDNKTKDTTIELTLEKPIVAAAASTVTVTRIAAVAHFTSDDWYVKQEVELRADPYYEVPLTRDGVKVFPASTHVLSRLRGPLAVEGGPTTADRSLQNGLKLPGETDAPLIQVGPQPPEGRAIDVLNLFNDASQADLSGTMTSTSVTGFGLPADLVLGTNEFGEPATFPGGISYGTIGYIDGQFVSDGARSTIEVVNFLGGAGNDHLDITGTLDPDAPVSATGTMAVADDAGAADYILAKTGVDWRAVGFLPGRR